jgi:hypothetical protein
LPLQHALNATDRIRGCNDYPITHGRAIVGAELVLESAAQRSPQRAARADNFVLCATLTGDASDDVVQKLVLGERVQLLNEKWRETQLQELGRKKP